MIQLPNKETRLWSQVNKGDVLGTLAGSFNLDLQTNKGKARTNGMIRTTTQGTNTDLTAPPVGFKYSPAAGNLWTVAGTRVHSTPVGTGHSRAPFSVDAIAGSPTTCDYAYSDIDEMLGSIYVTTKETSPSLGKLYKGNGSSTWTDMGNLAGGVFHAMSVYAGRLYVVASTTKIYSMSSAGVLATSGQYTLDLMGGASGNIGFAITCIRAASNKIWIGVTWRDSGKSGQVYEWDGSGSQTTRSYVLPSNPLSCVIHQDIPYFTLSSGQLVAYNGGSFVEVARLPVSESQILKSTTSLAEKWIHPNGMAIINNKINILVSPLMLDSSVFEFCPAGVWEYDPDIGLYHKASPSYTAVGGTAVTAWGQSIISRVGGISEMRTGDTNAAANGGYLIGAELYTSATALDNGVFINDTLDTTQKVGYIVTAQLSATEVADTFQNLWVTYRKLLNSGDKIIAKYRTSKQEPTNIVITWTSTTTFTTTDANMANYAVGDEVEILRGKGGGMCSHITVISLAAGTYTVTVDEVHTGATSGTATARLQKWVKAGSVSDTVQSWKQFSIQRDAAWIQLKIVCVWTGKNELEKLLVAHQPKQSAI